MSETLKQEIENNYQVKKKHYRANEAKEYLGVGLSTIWLYAKQGKLTPKKISARVTVFDVEELDRLANGEVA